MGKIEKALLNVIKESVDIAQKLIGLISNVI